MRSEQVFRAAQQVGNRYVLCRLAAKTTRRLHFASSSTQDAIQDAFVRMCTLHNGSVPSSDQAGLDAAANDRIHSKTRPS